MAYKDQILYKSVGEPLIEISTNFAETMVVVVDDYNEVIVYDIDTGTELYREAGPEGAFFRYDNGNLIVLYDNNPTEYTELNPTDWSVVRTVTTGTPFSGNIDTQGKIDIDRYTIVDNQIVVSAYQTYDGTNYTQNLEVVDVINDEQLFDTAPVGLELTSSYGYFPGAVDLKAGLVYFARYKTLYVVQMATGDIVKQVTLDGLYDNIEYLQADRTRNRLVLATGGQRFSVVDLNGFSLVLTNHIVGGSGPVSADITPDGKHILCATYDRVRVVRVADSYVEYERYHPSDGYAARFSAKYKYLCMGSRNESNFRIFQMIDEMLLGTFEGKYINGNSTGLQIGLPIGDVNYAENSNIIELGFENKTDVPIENVVISASTEPAGMDMTFSKTSDPFSAAQSLTFVGPYQPGESDTFYARIESTTSASEGPTSINLNIDADNVV